MGKSKWDSHVCPFLDKIEEWAKAGASQTEIAAKLTIAASTFKAYLARGDEGEEPYKDLAACLRRGCEIADDEVEAAMYKLCCGYTTKVKKTFKIKETIYDDYTGKKISETEKLVHGEDEVHVPANVEAQKFWLANRRGDKWKYPQQMDKNKTDTDDTERGVIVIPSVEEQPNAEK